MKTQRWLISTQRFDPATGVVLLCNVMLTDCHPVEWLNMELHAGRHCVLLNALKLEPGDPESLDE